MIQIKESYIDEAMLEYKEAQTNIGYKVITQDTFGHPVFEALVEECFETILENKSYYDSLQNYITINGTKYENLLSSMLIKNEYIERFITPGTEGMIYLKDLTKLSLIINPGVVVEIYYNDSVICLTMNRNSYIYDIEYDEILEDSFDDGDYDFVYFFLKMLCGAVNYRYIDNVIEFKKCK